ncbi:ATP phosphoribosyltransferase regulatory subunit [Nannocystis bainbridge]|uniref:ATP phosphoribosyltransferase regulatory subunit n=1 Tax=Nannocystis bainbridge TaxID=2995303 RepID=A0ABT5E4G0_9BACT|nr:ATP phosphoribosyltransferase regulatory subunit [Nannocystis bainbridge]MDC0719642.1 ATP phosphoribosyltransferase regulatory subunit [Nannocystis bainbridge]
MSAGLPEGALAVLPRGARDLLPGAARRRRALTEALLAGFDRWGYDPVVTPAIEYFAVFGRWLAERERQRCVRFIEAGSGELVTLRSDITPQIARLAEQQLRERLAAGEAVRLCYAADVVRLSEGTREQAERHQVGVELLGDDAPEADAELILLADEALRAAGVTAATIEVADVGIARGVFERLPSCDVEALHGLLARKDAGGVARFAAGLALGEAPRRWLGLLCELFGAPGILGHVPADIRARWPWLAERLARLEATLAVVEARAPELHARLVVDLGEVRGFDYYTGLRLRAWAPGSARPLVVGGRYAGGAGFAVELDALEASLDADAVTTATRAGGVMIAIQSREPRARALAAGRAGVERAAGRRAWVQVGLSLETAQAAAAEADALVYFGADERAEIWSQRQPGAWRRAEESGA